MSEDFCPLSTPQQECEPRLCTLENNKGGTCPHINYSNYRECRLYVEWLAKKKRENEEVNVNG